MTKRISRAAACVFVLLLLLPDGRVAHSQPQPGTGKKSQIKLIYGALTASNTPIWIGADQGLYEKYGLEVMVVHGRGASPIQALAGGTVEIGHFAGASVVAANLAGSDLVFVGAQTNYVVLSIWTRKDSPIKNLSELAGKTVGVSAPGSATHFNAPLSQKSRDYGQGR